MKIKVKIENQTFDVAVGDLNARPVIATVDGQTFEVYPEDLPRVVAPVMATVPLTAPVAAAPIAPSAPAPLSSASIAASGASGGANVVKAPIPGVIVSVVVKDGDPVKKGQEVCVLEAMKMKNSIRSQRDGKVISTKVKVGDHVQKDQVIFELGD